MSPAEYISLFLTTPPCNLIRQLKINSRRCRKIDLLFSGTLMYPHLSDFEINFI